jgi:hypothetical protein
MDYITIEPDWEGMSQWYRSILLTAIRESGVLNADANCNDFLADALNVIGYAKLLQAEKELISDQER